MSSSVVVKRVFNWGVKYNINTNQIEVVSTIDDEANVLSVQNWITQNVANGCDGNGYTEVVYVPVEEVITKI